MAPLGGITGIRPLQKPATDLPDGTQGRSTQIVSYDNEDDQTFEVRKLSVLAKVKEKARRWRNTLGTRKRDRDSTPAWGVSLEEEDEEEEDPRYHGTPMYEAEVAPAGDYKKTQVQQSAPAPPAITENNLVISKDAGTESYGSITETITNILAPAYAMVSEATQVIASKIPGLPLGVAAGATEESGSEENGDKGVSAKEYMMQKLDPGEEEKALSQVMSEAISPRKNDGNMTSVVEKLRVAVSSLLWIEEQPSKPSVSINPHAEIIEEKEETRLQTN